MIEIRTVEDKDWPEMGDVAEQAHTYTKLLPGNFDRDTWIRNWKSFSKTEGAMIYNLVVDGVVRGGICGSMTLDPANDDPVAVMMWWHILPKFRGHGIHLLKRWMHRARERGAVRLTLNRLLDLDSERLEPLYLRMGMKPLETTYILEL